MLPALSFNFGITWRDIETMPGAEVDAYLNALDEIGRIADGR